MTGKERNIPSKPRLKLPFAPKETDPGTWTYDHRIGLCVVLIVYLVLAIAFVASRIVVGSKPHSQGMLIDLQTLAELEQERDRLQEEVAERQSDPLDWAGVRNRVSNENMLNEALPDDRGTPTAELNRSAAEVEERMRANRAAYEQGVAEAEAIRRPQEEGDSGAAERQDARQTGRVTVSFSLVDPVRTSRHLVVPAYRCEGGGEVVVAITVDRGGEVVDASVRSGGDHCMRETALSAARRSRFNIDQSAPARQTGTITYLFIPQ